MELAAIIGREPPELALWDYAWLDVPRSALMCSRRFSSEFAGRSRPFLVRRGGRRGTVGRWSVLRQDRVGFGFGVQVLGQGDLDRHPVDRAAGEGERGGVVVGHGVAAVAADGQAQ